MKQLLFSSFILLILSSQAYASCTTEGCPEGQYCGIYQIDPTTGIYTCLPNDPDPPVPEFSLMMVPAALGVAGFFAYRARRNASK